MSAEANASARAAATNSLGQWNSAPACMLRKGLAAGIESSESSFEEAVRPKPDQPPRRFDHYELVTGEDGNP